MEAKEKLERFSSEVMSESALTADGDTAGLESMWEASFILNVLSLECPRFAPHSGRAMYSE